MQRNRTAKASISQTVSSSDTYFYANTPTSEVQNYLNAKIL